MISVFVSKEPETGILFNVLRELGGGGFKKVNLICEPLTSLSDISFSDTLGKRIQEISSYYSLCRSNL